MKVDNKNMSINIRSALHNVLAQKKVGKLVFHRVKDKNIRQGQFHYQCMVDGVNYVGVGYSQKKVDAMTNAAQDFGQYLIREGLISPAELQLQLGPSAMAPSQMQMHDFVAPPPSLQQDDQSSFSGSAYAYNQQQKLINLREKYAKKEAEQNSRMAEMLAEAEPHGGWTIDNSKWALNEFCQKNQLPLIKSNYKFRKTNGFYEAENELFLPKMNQRIIGRGQSLKKKDAENWCALSIVRQLFHMGAIPLAAEFAQKESSSTAKNFGGKFQPPEIKVRIDPDIVTRIERFLAESDVRPVLHELDSASPRNPCSLLIDHQKLKNFEKSKPTQFEPRLMWEPPRQNWNTWKGYKIGTFQSMDKISEELMKREMDTKIPYRITEKRRSLPVFKHREHIVRTITENPVVLIKGSTGCGKSTQICQYLLESHLLDGRGAHFNCYVTQPRRISAITLAERVAAERYEQLGESMGYSVRFEGVTPRPYGAVMFVTVGVLMRKLEMGLRGISHVIIDEIHERDINTDFLLIVIRDMVRAHPKLRVILMSATIDTTLFADYFGQCPIIEINEHIYPVKHFFLEETINMLAYMPEEKKKNNGRGRVDLLICGDDYPLEVRESLNRLKEDEIPLELIEKLIVDIVRHGKQGAILIFLPGWNVISEMLKRLKFHPTFGNTDRYVLLPLHSKLTSREQRRVFEPMRAGQRKIVLSTNIAETSVTIDDVVYVIDSCQVRDQIYSSRNNLTHFANFWASRTNLTQRRGRAGRVQEGFCFHLITQARFEAIEEHRTPEMLTTPLHEIALKIKMLRLGSVKDFLEKAIQPPPIDAVIEAECLLRDINALDENFDLTELGRILARLPIEPRMGKMLILGAALGIGDLMLTAAAAIDTDLKSPFVNPDPKEKRLLPVHRNFSGNRNSDHVGQVNCNQQFQHHMHMGYERAARNFCDEHSLSFSTLRNAREAKRQLFDVLTRNSGFPEAAFVPYAIDVHGPDPGLDLLLSMLVAAYYPNICYMRDRRRVFTLEQVNARLSTSSICVPFDSTSNQSTFPSPLFTFTEKLMITDEMQEQNSCFDKFYNLSPREMDNRILCTQLSMISPLQLLLFGCRKVEAIGPDKVLVDNMIPLEMPAKVAAQIVALRPCLEALIVRTCIHPEQLASQPQSDIILAELIRDLSFAEEFINQQPLNTAPYGSNAAGQNPYRLTQSSSNHVYTYGPNQ